MHITVSLKDHSCICICMFIKKIPEWSNRKDDTTTRQPADERWGRVGATCAGVRRAASASDPRGAVRKQRTATAQLYIRHGFASKATAGERGVSEVGHFPHKTNSKLKRFQTHDWETRHTPGNDQGLDAPRGMFSPSLVSDLPTRDILTSHKSSRKDAQSCRLLGIGKPCLTGGKRNVWSALCACRVWDGVLELLDEKTCF